MSTRACFIEHAGYVRMTSIDHDNPDMRYEEAWFSLKAVISGLKNKEQIECLAKMWACVKCKGMRYDADIMRILESITR